MNKKVSISIIVVLVLISIVYFYTHKKETKFTNEETVVQTETINKETVPIKESSDEKENVKKSFEQYKNSLLNNNSTSAISVLNQETINYYAEMLSLIKFGTKAEIQNKRLVDQITILVTRYKFDKATINKLKDGRDMLALAIDKGLIGKESVSGMSVNSVKISGNDAYAEIKTDQGIAPQKFHFVKESGIWKIDLTSILPEANIALKAVVTQSGYSEEEFIFAILESKYGAKPTEEIWKPVI